jgi:hypothetical protein
MAVDRVPLVAADFSGSVNEKSSIYDHSQTSTIAHGNNGWRSNLQSTMVFENRAQSYVNRLYPVSRTQSVGWSCPLRRIGFWTKNRMTSFSPLVPSPTRNARLFRDTGITGMTFGTRSHPTQKFAYLEELATILTSNGFCFCKDAVDCRKPITDNNPCGLKDTVKSLWDGQWRTSQSLFTNDRVCISQLDWPFVKAQMRDNTTKQSQNEAIDREGCNVVDRLPHFQYRFVFFHRFFFQRMI